MFFIYLHHILYKILLMKRLFIETYGCQMNVADSEVIASVMKMADYETWVLMMQMLYSSTPAPFVRMPKIRFTAALNSLMPFAKRARR